MFRISQLLQKKNVKEEILWNIVKISVERVMEPIGKRIGRGVGESDLVQKFQAFAKANLPGVPSYMTSASAGAAGVIAAALIRAPDALIHFLARTFGWPEAMVSKALQEGVDRLVTSISQEISNGTSEGELPEKIRSAAEEKAVEFLQAGEFVGILDASGAWHHSNCPVMHMSEMHRTIGFKPKKEEEKKVTRDLIPGARRLSLAEVLKLGIDVGHKPTCCRGVDGAQEAAMTMPRRLQDALGILQGSSELMKQHVLSLIEAISSSSDKELRAQYRKMLSVEFPPIFLRGIVLVAVGQSTPEARAKVFVSGLELGLEYKEPNFVDKAAIWAKQLGVELFLGEGEVLDAVRDAAEDVRREIEERRAEIRSARTIRVVPIARVGRPRPTPLPQGASVWRRLIRFVGNVGRGFLPL